MITAEAERETLFVKFQDLLEKDNQMQKAVRKKD